MPNFRWPWSRETTATNVEEESAVSHIEHVSAHIALRYQEHLAEIERQQRVISANNILGLTSSPVEFGYTWVSRPEERFMPSLKKIKNNKPDWF